jgi:hypothetical protein
MTTLAVDVFGGPGVPEKRVQSFAFFMGTAQPKHAEKGSGVGDSACLKLSWDRGDWGKVKGREAYDNLLW